MSATPAAQVALSAMLLVITWLISTGATIPVTKFNLQLWKQARGGHQSEREHRGEQRRDFLRRVAIGAPL